jgi:hypothetical protein
MAMLAAAFVLGVATYLRPTLWLMVVPALLPVIGFAPWSGWITFEELDILVLAVAAGGYARIALSSARQGDAHQRPLRLSVRGVLAWAVVAMFGLATVVAMVRGFADAGGFSFGWFQGYHEPMNSVRIAKSYFLALLLVPLWQAASRIDPQRTQALLVQGLTLGVALVALTTVWERAAFTGVLDFSSDYRTTGMFWEMHVGGAALDGFLVLTLPFALRALAMAHTPARWAMAAVVLVLATYASLTTFSRGVYLAVPVGVVIYFVLTTRNGLPRFARNDESSMNGNGNGGAEGSSLRGAKQHGNSDAGWIAGLLLVATFGVGAAWMFQSSGYRGMAALLTAVALLLPLARVVRRFNSTQWLVGGVLSLGLVLLAGVFNWAMPKGAYVAWVLASVLTAGILVKMRKTSKQSFITGPMAFAGLVATIAGVALVANHWGDEAGLSHAVPVLIGLLGASIVVGVRHKPLWPDSLRWQATVVGTMGLMAVGIGVFDGGAYMGDRFSTGGKDLSGRLTHWQLGRDLLHTDAEWLLGKGLGRFPANYFLVGDPQSHPGDYRLNKEAENNFVTLTSGLHPIAFGAMFRVTQRIGEPGDLPTVTANVRAAKDVVLYFEVCEKHLLYGQGCLGKSIVLKAVPGVWQEIQTQLQGKGASRGDWYAPRLLAFSVAIESRGGMVDLDNISLTRANGSSLLANGDFSDGMGHWFFSSDRNHLPWHIKNMAMNVLFEQGLVGLALWSLLLTGALWRVTLGAAHQNPLAPALAASLVGFCVVGLFDSLLDVPRVAWLFYLLLLIALTLPSRQSGSPRLAASR